MPTSEKKSGDAAAAHTPDYETDPILVGFDHSPGGDDALAFAHALVGTSDRKVIAEGVPFEIGPSAGLIGLAVREGAGTLVVGSPHRGKVGRALLGSVAHHVLHHSPCEVVVAPRGYAGSEARGIQRIGVAFDGTEEARTALRRAEALARDTGASLHLIVAEDPVVAGIEGGEEFTPLTNASAVLREALAGVAPSIEADGETLDPGWRQGGKSVAAAIADSCAEGIDVLVAGTRKPLDRLLMGSVTGHLIDLAPCAVLVVPHESR